MARPFLLLLVFSFAIIIAISIFLTYIQNRNAVENSQTLLSSFMAGQEDRLATLVLEWGIGTRPSTVLVYDYDSEWVASNFASDYIYDTLGVARVHVVDGAGKPVLSGMAGELVEIEPGQWYGSGFEAVVADARGTPDDTDPVASTAILEHGRRLFSRRGAQDDDLFPHRRRRGNPQHRPCHGFPSGAGCRFSRRGFRRLRAPGSTHPGAAGERDDRRDTHLPQRRCGESLPRMGNRIFRACRCCRLFCRRWFSSLS